MKTMKLLPVLLLASTFFLSCDLNKPNQDDDTDDGPVEEVKPPQQIIPITDAKILFDDYGENRVDLIQDAQNVDENGEPIPPDDERYVEATRSLTISFEDLEQYIKYVKQEAAAANQSISGLRFYLAKYPDKGTFPGGTDARYPGAETLFFNPVAKFDGTDEVSFAIVVGDDGSKRAVPVGELLGNDSEQQQQKGNGPPFILEFQDNVQSLAGNKMGRIPPPHSDENDF